MLYGSLFCESNGVVSVQAGYVFSADFLRANSLTFIEVGAVTKTFSVHLAHHAKHTLVFFRCSLWKQVEVGSLG